MEIPPVNLTHKLYDETKRKFIQFSGLTHFSAENYHFSNPELLPSIPIDIETSDQAIAFGFYFSNILNRKISLPRQSFQLQFSSLTQISIQKHFSFIGIEATVNF